MNILFVLIATILLVLALSRTSNIRSFISYCLSIMVIFKGLHYIHLGASISFGSLEDAINTICMLVVVELAIVGIDALCSD